VTEDAIEWRGGKINHLSIAQSLHIICTKNYWNWTIAVKIIKIIVGGWVIYFFFETHCW